MERPGHLGQISKGVGRPVIWRCSDRPLLWLSLSLVLLPFSLPPSTASHPQDLSRCCQLPAQLYTQDQPGDRVDGEEDIKKECKKKKGRFWGASQACRLAANNTRDQFLWTLMSSFSYTKKTSVGPIHSPDTERQKEKGRGRKSNGYGSNLVSCQETRQGSIHQWQTRQAADWAGWLLLVMCGVIRAKYTNASHVRSWFGIKMWA